MAKKQITSSSSPTEIRAAQEQLSQAQQEFNTLYRQKFNNQGASAIDISKAAEQIAAKYDYVDFGQMQTTTGNEINIGGDQFFVQGLGNQTNSVSPPSARTTINADDAFPATRPAVSVTPMYNKQGVNPNQAMRDQSLDIDTNPQPVTLSPQVTPDTNAMTAGQKDANQAGAAIESYTKASSIDSQNGIVNQNPNNISNNISNKLTNQFSRDPTVSSFKQAGSTDDAASKATSTISNSQTTVNDTARSSASGSVTAGTTNSTPIPEATPGTTNKPGIKTRPNMLHDYVNWTYKIAWYMLKNGDYNSIITSGKVTNNVGTLIAKSGGVGSQLNSVMPGDIYFRNLRISSAIGNRAEAAATNNFELEMTVVEPYGASLIAQLGGMALNLTGLESISPAEPAYLLEIDFAGYKDDGSMIPSILGNTSGGKKYIPVKIIDVEMTLESAGSVYVIKMAPYSYFAQTARYADMEFGLTLKGTKVEEMLGDVEGGLISQLNLWEQLKVSANHISKPDKYAIQIYSFDASGKQNDKMKNSPFAYPQAGGDATVRQTRPASHNSPSYGTYTVVKGSLIKDTIRNVIMSSQYFNEKVKPQDPNNQTDPAEMIKIIPVIELTDDFDTARNEYAKKITFKVFNTLLFGEIIPGVGNAPVSNWGYGKEYNWLFTGKNSDVIEANLSYKYVYFTKMQTNILDYNTTKLGQPAASERALSEQSNFSKLAIPVKAGGISSSGSNFPERYINSAIVAEWFDSKMSSYNGDNMTLDLKIIGDPDWIPQDASIRGGEINVPMELYDIYNSVAIDVAGVYIKLNLRTPRDYNDQTGLMEITNSQQTVQGVYQVTVVESLFEDGRFSQTLKCTKVPNQEEEKPNLSTSGRDPDKETPGTGSTRGSLTSGQSVNIANNPTPLF